MPHQTRQAVFRTGTLADQMGRVRAICPIVSLLLNGSRRVSRHREASHRRMSNLAEDDDASVPSTPARSTAPRVRSLQRMQPEAYGYVHIARRARRLTACRRRMFLRMPRSQVRSGSRALRSPLEQLAQHLRGLMFMVLQSCIVIRHSLSGRVSCARAQALGKAGFHRRSTEHLRARTAQRCG